MPRLGQAPAPRDAASLAATLSLPGTAVGWPVDRWWTTFGDAALSQLIDEALVGSPDVATATARVRAADAMSQQAGAALLPSATLDGIAGGNKQSYNLGIPAQFVPKGIQDTGRLSGSFSFNLDIWGKDRAALAAATSEAAAVRVDLEQARLMLSTDIATNYAQLAQYYMQRDVAEDALKIRQATVDLTSQRVAVGVDTRGSLRQAESRVPAARADIAALDESIALTRHRLAALVGAGPDRGRRIVRPTLRETGVGIPSNAGIDLVGRRPDIVAARLRAEAAAKRIKVAKADFYPNISLSAIVGLQSLGLGKLFESGSSYGNGGAAFSLPIFDGGRLAGRYRGARADYDEAVSRYDATLIIALQQTADALTSRQAADVRLAEQRQALAAAEEARKIAAIRYRGGLSNQLPVLNGDDTVLISRRAVADLEARRIVLDIALIRALGGGYHDTRISSGAR
ncbi:efflux transporter outer membrane subunit [Sphingomonas sp.]|uniref:efflux transporter outer membrane subunit n=1 Tax=Sphingomonas sp. TaxID=28214 RepID=UPI0025EC17C5|nr:efflux transporter outer membrane subunit [Sphingomonas sp.]